LAQKLPVTVRFIEFMPFDGNRWNSDKMVTASEIRSALDQELGLARLSDGPNDMAKHYSVPGFAGKIGIISSMTEQFCGSCNRIRLLANGSIKNCLFSGDETDSLEPFRRGEDLNPIIKG